MNRRTAFAIAAATITTLGTGAVTAAAMSGSDDPRVEAVASPRTTDDRSPTSTRQSERAASDDTSTTTRTTAPTTTRSTDDNSERSTSTTTRTAAPTGVSPTSNIATFRSLGGEVDVTWTAQTLTIVAVRPAAGFRTESEEQDGDEVEAEFESGAHDSKITVRLVNGSPSASVRERDHERVGDDDGADDRSGHDDGADNSDDRGHGSEREDDHGGGRGRG